VETWGRACSVLRSSTNIWMDVIIFSSRNMHLCFFRFQSCISFLAIPNLISFRPTLEKQFKQHLFLSITTHHNLQDIGILQLGERRYSSYSFLTSTLNGVSGEHHATAVLYPRVKDSRYPLYRRLGGPQRGSGHRGYRKNPLLLPGIIPQSPGRPVHSQTLYWLSYPGY
jgi:hypothetical protein